MARSIQNTIPGLLALVLLASVLPNGAAAGDRKSPDNLPVCTLERKQVFPTIVSDDCGGAIVAWLDGRDGEHWAIYVQHLVDGTAVDPAWPANGLAIRPGTNGQTAPVMIADGAGGAILAWAEVQGVEQQMRILVQHVLANGVLDPRWDAGGAPAAPAPGPQIQPALAADGRGGAFVTWMDRRNPLAYGVYVQHVSAAGSRDPAWPAAGLAVADSPGQLDPRIIADAEGAIITWVDGRRARREVFAHRVGSDGALDPGWPAGGRALSTAPRQQFDPRLIGDRQGGAIVTWVSLGPAGADIHAQHVLRSGEVDAGWPADGAVVCSAAGDQLAPEIVADGRGGAIVAWQDRRNDGDQGPFAQHVLADGRPDPDWAKDGRALSTPGRSQSGPQAIEDGRGGAIVTWSEFVAGDRYEIYVQHAKATGVLDPAWPDHGRALSGANHNRYLPVPVPDGRRGVIVAWIDERDPRSGPDVYAQAVRAHGQLEKARLPVPAAVTRGPTAEGPESFAAAGPALALEPVRPNPAHPGEVLVWFTLGSFEPASIELLDVAGRRHASLDVGALGPGRHWVRLNPRTRLAPGVFFLRLRQGSFVQVQRLSIVE